jgi:hypothetical protein
MLELSLILFGCSYFENSWATGASAASAFGGVNVFIRNYAVCRMSVIERLFDQRGKFFVFYHLPEPVATRYAKVWSNPAQGAMQIAQLVVKDTRGVNVAKGKTCSASSVHSSGATPCSNALDGVESVRDFPSIYHSANPEDTGQALEWFLVDLGASYYIPTVVYYNRGPSDRAVGMLLQLLDSDMVVTGQRTMNTDAVQTFTFSTTVTSVPAVTYLCDAAFEGGGWVLVRRMRQGARWHPATDDLKGLDVYGAYGTPTSDATFSVAYGSWLTQSTEFFFATGTLN